MCALLIGRLHLAGLDLASWALLSLPDLTRPGIWALLSGAGQSYFTGFPDLFLSSSEVWGGGAGSI